MTGNDISEATDVKKLIANYLVIQRAIYGCGVKCVLSTKEKRECAVNHPHYINPVAYNKLMNAVNEKLTKELTGKIIFLETRPILWT